MKRVTKNKKRKKSLLNIPTASIILFSLFIFLLSWSVYQKHLYTESAALFDNSDISLSFSEAGDGDYVFLTGKPDIEINPTDRLLGVSADGYVLARNVEMYQYYISSDSLKEGFCSSQKAEVIYKNSDKYTNPVWPEGLESEVYYGKISIGPDKAVLGENFISAFRNGCRYFESEHNKEKLTNLPAVKNSYGLTPYSDGYYSGDPDNPRLGDIRVTYEYIPVTSFNEISVLGVRSGNSLDAGDINFMADYAATPESTKTVLCKTPESTYKLLRIMAFASLIFAVILLLKEGITTAGAKKRLRILLMFALLICTTLLPIQKAKADFGDYGGGSDYGGYDYGGYDYGSHDYGGSDYNNDSNDSYQQEKVTYYSYGFYPDSSYVYKGTVKVFNYLYNEFEEGKITGMEVRDESGASAVAGEFFLLGIVDTVLIVFKNQKKKYRFKPLPKGAISTSPALLNSIKSYIETKDENFSEETFRKKAGSMYIRLQNAWQAKDLEPVRDCLTDEFYNKNNTQLDNYRKNHQTNIIEDISVESVFIKGWKEENGNDVIIANLKTNITDYVIDDNTGEVIKGNRNEYKKMNYEFSFIRKSGIKTGENEKEFVCPNCGAPLDINSSAKCEYCDSVIIKDATDWCINSIKGISQKTYPKT